MKFFKKVFIVFLALIVIFCIGALTYKTLKSQGVIETYTVNDISCDSKILIATQQSTFKDKVMQNIKEYYLNQPVLLSVIDVTNLSEVTTDEWDGIIIFSTIESTNIHPEVESFLKELEDYSQIYMINTADSGKWKNKNIEIDCITSPSKKTNIEPFTNEIIAAIDGLL